MDKIFPGEAVDESHSSQSQKFLTRKTCQRPTKMSPLLNDKEAGEGKLYAGL